MNYIIAACKNGRLDLTTQIKNNAMFQFSLNHHYNTKIFPDFFFLILSKPPLFLFLAMKTSTYFKMKYLTLLISIAYYNKQKTLNHAHYK